MAIGLLAILIGAVIYMPPGLPAGRKKAKISEVFSKDSNINRLSAARFFLFGARDVWFVVGVPIYFHSILIESFVFSSREAFFIVGGFMALWVIAYGAVQASAPKLLKSSDKTLQQLVNSARQWAALLTIVPASLLITSLLIGNQVSWFALILTAGLLVFGAVFALNSAIHSFLILAFSNSSRVTMDVGFYYMSNAAGRLAGTLLSGLSFQFGGLSLCLLTAFAMCGFSWAIAARMNMKFSD